MKPFPKPVRPDKNPVTRRLIKRELKGWSKKDVVKTHDAIEQLNAISQVGKEQQPFEADLFQLRSYMADTLAMCEGELRRKNGLPRVIARVRACLVWNEKMTNRFSPRDGENYSEE